MKKTISRWLLAVFLSMALAPAAMAQSNIPTQQQASATVDSYVARASKTTDKATQMMCSIFGGDVVNAVSIGEPCGGAKTETMTGTAFGILNAGILAIGIVMFAWTIGSGIVNTAHDGEFLGKKYHTFWMPVRAVMGVTALVPIPAIGMWSLAQAVMMWMTMIGIGLADIAWEGAVEKFVSGQSVLFATPPDPKTKEAAWMIFEAELCAQTINKGIERYGAEQAGFNAYRTQPTQQGATAGTTSDPARMTMRTFPGGWTYADEGGHVCGGVQEADLGSNQQRQVNSATSQGNGADSSVTAQIKRVADSLGQNTGLFTMNSVNTQPVSQAVLAAHRQALAAMQQKIATLVSSKVVPVVLDRMSSTKPVIVENNQVAQSESGMANSAGMTSIASAACAGSQQGGANVAGSNSNCANMWEAISTTINDATKEYEASVRQAMGSSMAKSNEPLSVAMVAASHNNGWLTAGGFYTTVSKINANLSNIMAAHPTPAGEQQLEGVFYADVYRVAAEQIQIEYNKYKAVEGAANRTGGINQGNQTANNGENQNVLFNIIAHPFLKSLDGLTSLARNDGGGLTGGNTQINTVDPIVAMKSMGDYMLDGAWFMVGMYSAANSDFLMKAAKSVSTAVAGFAKGGGNPVGGAINSLKDTAEGVASDKVKASLWQSYAPVLGFAMFALFSFGFMLAIWVPMMPVFIWLGCIIAWLTVVVEAVVAAPLWAMVHLDGEGEGLPQKSTHGYIFMLYLCFYPILLVIGFIFSMAVVKVMGGFWLDWYMWLVEDAETNTLSGVFALFGYITLFISGMMMIVNRTFESLLVRVPGQVFAWVGGHFTGAAGGHEEAQRNVNAVGGGTVNVGQQGRQAAQQLERDNLLRQQTEAKTGGHGGGHDGAAKTPQPTSHGS